MDIPINNIDFGTDLNPKSGEVDGVVAIINDMLTISAVNATVSTNLPI